MKLTLSTAIGKTTTSSFFITQVLKVPCSLAVLMIIFPPKSVKLPAT